MNCDDYLAMLTTLPVEELSFGRAREHAAGCRDCDRVTRVVAEREHNLVSAFDDLHSSVPATQTAASALVTSRRRKVALFYNIGLGIVMAASVLYYVAMRRVVHVPAPSATVSEAFRLQCLSPEQAAEVVRPHLQETGRIAIRPTSTDIITVWASREQMERARSALDRYDNPAESKCAVQAIVPKVP